MITLSEITKIYSTGQNQTTAINNFNLEIKKGDFIAIMGKSGCGKSTLLNILGLMDKPDEGEYIFNGINLTGLSENKASDFRSKHIAYIFQEFYLIDELSVFDNVAMPLVYRKLPKKEINAKTKQTLEQIGLLHRRNHLAKEISGGEAQRTAIARALIYEPSLILADEPTGNLDEENSRIVMDILKDLNKKGKTILMVTHEAEIAAHAKKIIKLKDGKIIEEINNDH